MAIRTDGERTIYTGEDAWRHAMGDTLYEIAERGNYSLVTGSAMYLRWGKNSKIKNPNYFNSLFDEFEIFEYHFAIPTVRFVKAYFFRRDRWEGHHAAYKELRQPFAQDKGHVPEKKLPILISKRDALEKQIERNGRRIREPLNDLLAILKVWIVEAENALLEGRKPPELSKEELVALNELQKGTKRLWSHIMGGKPVNAPRLSKMLSRPGLPEEFVRAQASGLALHLEKRDQIIEETIPLHRRWWALEALLKRALIGEPVMTEEEVKELQPEPDDDRDTHVADRNWEKRKRALAKTLLARRADGKLVMHPRWSGKSQTDLFFELAQGDSGVSGRHAAENLVRSFSERMGDSFPTGRGTQKWVPVAKVWAKAEMHISVSIPTL